MDIDAFGEVSAGLRVTVCQMPQWLQYLKYSQGTEPVLAEVLHDGVLVGIFSGALERKAGLRILGSPLRGWTAGYMGFALQEGIEGRSCRPALTRFAFDKLRSSHLEVLGRNLYSAGFDSGWQGTELHGFEIDFTQPEEAIFAAMTAACRRCIRKAEKSGLVVEEVQEISGYAHQYYCQLQQVFAKRGLAPSYAQRRVEQLIEALQPSGMLLLLRARDSRGRIVATSLFPGYGAGMYFWGGASAQDDSLLLRPNEAMMWHAMRWWKARGAERFDMGGGGSYKAKYGGAPISVPWMGRSSSPAVAALRVGAEKLLRLKQRITGRLGKP